MSQSKEIFTERIRLKSQLEQLQSDYEELASGILPLAMVKPLLVKIQAQCQQEREIKNMKLAVDTIGKLLNTYSGEKNEISKFIGYVKNRTVKSHNRPVFDFSENAYSQISLLNCSDITYVEDFYISQKKQEEQKQTVHLQVLDFRVWVTPQQMWLLQEFLIKNNIKYGRVE